MSGVFSFLMRQTVVVASRHIEYDLRNALYEHLQKLSQAFYHRTSTGDVITRSTDDIEQVRRYIGPAIMYVTRATVIMVTAITVMLIISPKLTLYALLPMPLLAVSVFFVAHLVHTRSRALQTQYSKLTSRVQEALSGIRVLKAYTREESEARAFEQESDAYRERMLSLALVDAAWRPVFLLIVGLSQIIVVWMGGRLVVELTDTGPGFTVKAAPHSVPALDRNTGHAGRGIPLVRSFCQELQYSERGNSVRAVYEWK